MATRWLIRLGVLALIPGLLAFADSVDRPINRQFGGGARVSEPRGEEDHAADIARLVEMFYEGAALFIDARPRREYVAGHLSGAIHLPFEAFLAGRPAVLDLIPPDVPYLIYCGGGDCDASHKVREMLETFGFHSLEVFEPGWPGIEESELPIQQGEGDWE